MATALVEVSTLSRGDIITLPDAPGEFTVESNHRIGIATSRVELNDGQHTRPIDLHPGYVVQLTGWKEHP